MPHQKLRFLVGLQEQSLVNAIDLATNKFPYVALYTAQNLGVSLLFLRALQEKHDVSGETIPYVVGGQSVECIRVS